MRFYYFNKVFLLLSISGVLLGISLLGSAQCVPDTVNCKDEGNPGQICPDSLPNGMQGIEYNEIITFYMPDSASFSDAGLELVKIRLDTVENLPSGIQFISAEKEFYPDSVYCFELIGTPVDTGIFYIKITITPFINILGNAIALPAQSDSTNIVIRIEAPSTLTTIPQQSFSLIPGYPNPFLFTTKIGFHTQNPGKFKLVIYNMLGKQIYQEYLMASEESNYFKFSGENLPTGIYIYTVIENETRLKGKLIKTK